MFANVLGQENGRLATVLVYNSGGRRESMLMSMASRDAGELRGARTVPDPIAFSAVVYLLMA